MENIYYPSADGKTTVHACIWQPQGEVKGIVQIIHGMAEYAARYAPFAEFLAERGFIVCADDHLGHGESVRSEDYLGYFDDNHNFETVLADIYTLTLKVKELAADKPYFVLGHSMGSFFCRNYIARYGSSLAGAVIMGSGFKDKFTLNFALLAVKINALFCGWRNRSRLIKSLAFGSYNKRFKGKGNDWLSANKQNVINYDNDKLCGFDFTNNGYYVLFSVIKRACASKTINAVPKNLPVCFVAGADDPVGDYGKGVKRAYDKFVKAGISDVELTLYRGMRHEILNDDCKEQVKSDLIEFIENRLN